MGKKDFGVNTKKEEARDRKDTQKKDKQAAEEKKKEDSKWADNDKKIAKKDAKDVGFCVMFQKEEREKEAAKQRAKEEKKALLEAEEAEISKSTSLCQLEKAQPTVVRKTKYEVDQYKEKLEEMEEKKAIHNPLVAAGVIKDEKNQDDDSDDYENNLEVNWNHVWREQYMKDIQQYDEIVDATGIDEILKQTDAKNQTVDMHPEKRMKAAWGSFLDEEMPKYRKENPTLKRSQILQMMSKDWQTHPHNPIVRAKELGIWKPAKFQKGGKKDAEEK